MVPISPLVPLGNAVNNPGKHRAGLARQLSLAHRQGVRVSPVLPKEAWRAHAELYQQLLPAADQLLGPQAASPSP